MTLAVAARFLNLTEAEVAASALRAAGLNADVLDRGYGVMQWMQNSTLGGFRVVVPANEGADASALLAEINRAPPRRRPDPRDRGVFWRILVLGLGLYFGPACGWLVVAARRRRYASHGPSLVTRAVFSVAAATFLVAVLLFLQFLFLRRPAP